MNERRVKFLVAAAWCVAMVSLSRLVYAEFCWEYSDARGAPTTARQFSSSPRLNTYSHEAFLCVQQDQTSACSWMNGAGNCTAIPDPLDGQSCTADADCSVTDPRRFSNFECFQSHCRKTVLRDHNDWHACFGATGTSSGINPPGRGGRWAAFHRQFEGDFNLYREGRGFSPVESLDWCPNMALPWGHHGADITGHPDGCGASRGAIGRPSGVSCLNCIAFPHCLFAAGAGPIACPTSPSSSCAIPMSGGASFPYTSLDQFANTEEVTSLLDAYFHGAMHGAAMDGDAPGLYNRDLQTSTCSPRDPMFWRLHHALDDVVRGWQNLKAADVSVVLDRSGSMGDTDATGQHKFEVALNAMTLFGDLLEEGRSDGQTNRLGIVSFSNAAAPEMPLTAASSGLTTSAPFQSALTNIRNNISGCTSIGGGLTQGVTQLATGANPRKGILLLTDGMENRSPCLLSSQSTETSSCATQCGGPTFNYGSLGQTQICAVGFGQQGQLNQNLLTQLAERQGGIYTQSSGLRPDGTWDDLRMKKFFVNCFGHLSDENLGTDPEGTIGANALASDPVSHSSCTDAKLTFVGAWDNPAPAIGLTSQAKWESSAPTMRLLVNAPNGDLVQFQDPAVEAAAKETTSFARVRLPHHGQAEGTWNAQLVREHRSYVNGFTTDSLESSVSVPLVRREIQRLCPDGCPSVLYFEDGHKGMESSYDRALAAEEASGLVGARTTATTPEELAGDLEEGSWDLVVYAHQLTTGAEPYDAALERLLCQASNPVPSFAGALTPGSTQRAIVTDTRIATGDACGIEDSCPSGFECRDGQCRQPGYVIDTCAGGEPSGANNFVQLTGDARLLEGTHSLANPGYALFSYALHHDGKLNATFPVDGQALAAIPGAATSGDAAVAALGAPNYNGFTDQRWFINVLTRGLGVLTPIDTQVSHVTGRGLLATAQVLPSYIPAGGFDSVTATVDVDVPNQGLGATMLATGHQPTVAFGAESFDNRAAAYRVSGEVPVSSTHYVLNDDGTNGDIQARNGFFTAQTNLGAVDGMYKFHFSLDFASHGCTSHRELVQSLYVDVDVDPANTPVQVTSNPGGDQHVVTFLPRDVFGNAVGWGRNPNPQCGPAGQCTCSAADVVDKGDGSYTVTVHTAPGVPVSACAIGVFGSSIGLGGPSGSWPMFGRIDQRSHASPLSGPASSQVLWSVSQAGGKRPDLVHAPLRVDDCDKDDVHDHDDGHDHEGDDDGHGGDHDSSPAFHIQNDSAKQEEEHCPDAGPGDLTSSPAVGPDGSIYIGSEDGRVYAVNPDGTVRWRRDTHGRVRSSPAVALSGRVFVGSDDHKLYALDGATGQVACTRDLGGEIESSPVLAADGTVYVGSADHNVYALDPDCKVRWKRRTHSRVDSSPALDPEGLPYVGSDDGRLYALTTAGTVRWSFRTGGAIDSSPAFAHSAHHSMIVVGSDDHKVYAVDPDNGELIWKTNLGGRVDSSPAASRDGTLFIGSDRGRVVALDGDTGRVLWERDLQSDVVSSPAVAGDGTVFAASRGGKIVALRPDSGGIVWGRDLHATVRSSPAVGPDRRLYIGSDGAVLFAFGLPSTSHPTAPSAGGSSCSLTSTGHRSSLDWAAFLGVALALVGRQRVRSRVRARGER